MAVYAVATMGILVAHAMSPGSRQVAAAVVLVVGLALSNPRWATPLYGLLLWDLIVSVAVWWLYGPISGAALIALAVVAVAPLLLDRRLPRIVLFAALATVPIEAVAHFLAGVVDLPLFHPPDPVPTSEFLLGAAIQVALYIGVGVLLTAVAQMLRRGERALAADLERERELSRLKDRFVATVSHELRTPLTSLKGFTRTLLDEDVGLADRTEFLEIMADQADELHGRIEDLITFSRMGAGGITIRPESADLSHLTGEAIAELGADAERVVENRVPRGLRAWVDPPRIRQVIRNLVDNALVYGATPVVVVASLESDSAILLQVLDSGGGIPPEDMDRVFERYSRLVDDPTMAMPGLGLGLPIVRGLVTAHGGMVRIVTGGDLNGVAFTMPASPSDSIPSDKLTQVGSSG